MRERWIKEKEGIECGQSLDEEGEGRIWDKIEVWALGDPKDLVDMIAWCLCLPSSYIPGCFCFRILTCNQFGYLSFLYK